MSARERVFERFNSAQRRLYNAKLYPSPSVVSVSKSRRDFVSERGVNGRELALARAKAESVKRRSHASQNAIERRDSNLLDDDCIKRPKGGRRTRGTGVTRRFVLFC